MKPRKKNLIAAVVAETARADGAEKVAERLSKERDAASMAHASALTRIAELERTTEDARAELQRDKNIVAWLAAEREERERAVLEVALAAATDRATQEREWLVRFLERVVPALKAWVRDDEYNSERHDIKGLIAEAERIAGGD